MLTRNHPLGEGHEHANMALGPVQGTEHRAEPTPKELQGKYGKQGWLQQWTTIKQPEQPQKALPPMSRHRNTSWPLTAKKCGELAKFWAQAPWDKMQQHDAALDIDITQRAAPGTKTSQKHNTARQTPGKTRATAQETHSTVLKSSNLPMAAAGRRQGQQLYAWHGTHSTSLPAASPFPLTTASEATQPELPALPLEAWPCECNIDKATQPKRDKVFPNTTHS